MSEAAAATRNARRRSLETATAVGTIAVLVATAGVGFSRSIDALIDEHQRYDSLDHVAREQAAGTHEGFDPDIWAFIRRGVHRGDRYVIVTPKGARRGLVDQAFVTRTYANYFLLPAVQVPTRRDASVVVFVGTPAPRSAVCTKESQQSACILRPRA